MLVLFVVVEAGALPLDRGEGRDSDLRSGAGHLAEETWALGLSLGRSMLGLGGSSGHGSLLLWCWASGGRCSLGPGWCTSCWGGAAS